MHPCHRCDSRPRAPATGGRPHVNPAFHQHLSTAGIVPRNAGRRRRSGIAGPSPPIRGRPRRHGGSTRRADTGRGLRSPRGVIRSMTTHRRCSAAMIRQRTTSVRPQGGGGVPAIPANAPGHLFTTRFHRHFGDPETRSGAFANAPGIGRNCRWRPGMVDPTGAPGVEHPTPDADLRDAHQPAETCGAHRRIVHADPRPDMIHIPDAETCGVHRRIVHRRRPTRSRSDR